MIERAPLSLDELIEIEGFERAEITAWVERRWVLPVSAGEAWQFSAVDAARARLLRSLHRDMGFDEDTIGLILSLVDEVHALRTDLNALVDAIRTLPEGTRQDLLAGLADARVARDDDATDP